MFVSLPLNQAWACCFKDSLLCYSYKCIIKNKCRCFQCAIEEQFFLLSVCLCLKSCPGRQFPWFQNRSPLFHSMYHPVTPSHTSTQNNPINQWCSLAHSTQDNAALITSFWCEILYSINACLLYLTLPLSNSELIYPRTVDPKCGAVIVHKLS